MPLPRQHNQHRSRHHHHRSREPFENMDARATRQASASLDCIGALSPISCWSKRGSQNELAQILVLHNFSQSFPDIIGGDRYFLLAGVGRVEADCFEDLFQDRVEPAGPMFWLRRFTSKAIWAIASIASSAKVHVHALGCQAGLCVWSANSAARGECGRNLLC